MLSPPFPVPTWYEARAGEYAKPAGQAKGFTPLYQSGRFVVYWPIETIRGIKRMDRSDRAQESMVPECDLLEHANATNSFMRHNGIQAIAVSLDKGVTEAVVEPHLLNPNGQAHGGLYFTLMDTAAGLVARADGRRYVTLNCTTSFHRPALSGRLRAVGRVTQRTRGICVVQAEVRDDAETLYASGIFTMYCLDR